MISYAWSVVHTADRIWQPAVALLEPASPCITLFMHPPRFAAWWGLLDGLVSVLCGAAVGAWVDSQPRLLAASRMYLLQVRRQALSSCIQSTVTVAVVGLLSCVHPRRVGKQLLAAAVQQNCSCSRSSPPPLAFACCRTAAWQLARRPRWACCGPPYAAGQCSGRAWPSQWRQGRQARWAHWAARCPVGNVWE